MAPPSFAQLEQAASNILQLIRNTRGLENTRLAVIGDMAVRKYLPQYTQIASIDLVVSKSSSPGRVRKEIVGHPMSPLKERGGDIFYRHASSGWEIKVKLIPDWLCPYLPDAARPARDGPDTLPYVSLEDLLVFKLDECGLHENPANKRREAHVAAALLELAAKHCPLILAEDKMDRVEQALPDVVEFSLPEHDKSWWQRSLGKTPDKRRTPKETLSELADHAFSPTSPVSSTPGSTISRSSSYFSSASQHSTSSSISSVSTHDNRSDEHARPRKMSVTSKHKRHTSTGGPVTKTGLEEVMKRLELERPASPGIAFTNRI